MDYVYYTVGAESEAAQILADVDKRQAEIRKSWRKFFTSPLVKPTLKDLPKGWNWATLNNHLIGIGIEPYGEAREWVQKQVQATSRARVPKEVPWRYDEKANALVPARKTSLGKKMGEALDQISPSLNARSLTLAMTKGKVSYSMCSGHRTASMILCRSTPKEREKAGLHLITPMQKDILLPTFDVVLGVPYGFYLPGAHGVGPKGDPKEGKEALQPLDLFRELRPKGLNEVQQSVAVVLVNGTKETWG